VILEGVRYDSAELWHKHIFRTVLKDGEEDEAPEEYHLGKFCFSRTLLFHKLHHYKFHLLEKCCQKIDKLGYADLLGEDDISLEDSNAENDNDSKLDMKTECLQSLLDDHDWVSELIHQFNLLIDETTKFNKSTHATEEKQRRE